MDYLKNPFRQAIRFALILSCLLNSVGGPASAERRPRSSRQPHSSPAIDLGKSDGTPAMSTINRQTKARVRRAHSRLPLRFEANVGQVDSQVKFYSRGSGYNLFLTPTEAVLTLRNEKSKGDADLQSVMRPTGAVPALRNEKPKGDANPQSVVRMKFAGVRNSPKVEGIEALPGKSHYFIGNDPSKWRRQAPGYAKVRYRGVYHGIDVVYYGNQQELEYDFIVAPGADPKAILLAFEGTRRMEVDAQGDLVLHTIAGQVRQRKPVTYQEVDGRRREIASRYRMEGGNRVGFEIASYDRSQPLVIDPALAYSTYLGGVGFDTALSVAVDAEGNVYVAGNTGSLDFPTAEPLQPGCNNCSETQDIYVAKLNREGSALLYSTYLGGSDTDFISDLAVDEEGNAYLAGNTLSDDFPTKDPLQPARAGDSDVFVTKLNASGSALVYSTYLGGSHIDFFPRLAVDREGSAYVAGSTQSTDFPTRNPLQPAPNGGTEAFVTKLNASGSALVYSTYLGGSDAGVGRDGDITGGLAVDQAGNVYVAGWTTSTDFPTVNPLQPAIGGGQDAFVTKLNADGTAIVYSTYLGGAGRDDCRAVAVDALGNAYLTGETGSTNFPTASPLQPALLGPADAFVSKINQDGSALVYSTYLGGTIIDPGTDIAVDAKGQACVTGATLSPDFPTADVAQPRPEPMQGDAFVVKLNPGGSDFIYSSYLGGGGAEAGFGIAVDAWGDVYVVGNTDSDDLSVTPKAFQRRRRGVPPPPPSNFPTEGFITKISNQTRSLNHDHGHNGDDKDHQ